MTNLTDRQIILFGLSICYLTDKKTKNLKKQPRGISGKLTA